jgi:hypothetical protein
MIPDSVTSIGSMAFDDCGLTNITIPTSVTSIGDEAFAECTSLTAITVATNNPAYSSADGVLFNKSQTTLIQYPSGKAGAYAIPNSVTGIEFLAFYRCTGLTSVTIGNGVSSMSDYAFEYCESLTSVTIGNGFTGFSDYAFDYCTNLTGVYFKGNAPSPGSYMFTGDNQTIGYYLPGTTGWGVFSTNTGLPVVLWTPQVQSSGASFGVRTNHFGFNINWASGMTVVVEACTNVANPTWYPIGTTTLTGDSAYFSDPQWTNYTRRFYRLTMP